MTPKRVAVMQPYFFPYAGYFRLFASVDEFVIFDCVQFPRGGRVHRCELPGPSDAIEWLTLPLAPCPTSTRIRDLRFAAHARETLDRRLTRHAWIATAKGPQADRVREFLHAPLGSVVDYLEDGLRLVVESFGLATKISRSSALDIDPALRGQARVVAVVKAVAGTHYINAPGGRALYDCEAFSRVGAALSFLAPYDGEFMYLLPAMMLRDAREIADDVARTSSLQLP